MTLLSFPGPRSTGREPSMKAPQTVEETGLSQSFLVELVAKVMHRLGLVRLTELSAHLCLSGAVVESLAQHMRREGLLEVTRRGDNDADTQFELTRAGQLRAGEWLARSQYTGAAPVPLAAYRERVAAQSAARQPITREQVREAFAGLVVPEALQDLLGTAINAARPVLLYGEAGSGKTWLAEHLARLMPGEVAIPHAICVDHDVVRVFDPHWHVPVGEKAVGRAPLDIRLRPDPRWIVCERPVVVTGGELTLEMLDLAYDERAGFYEAPPHFKANNGLFIVDDLGRQIVSPHELMNRWIVPMDRRYDHLMLRSGGKFTIPFDLHLVFSSNLRPSDLDDAAFLRRLGHKIHVGPLGPDDYRLVFMQACEEAGVELDAPSYQHLVDELHGHSGRPTLACYPRDLVRIVVSRCGYLGEVPALTPERLAWAWHVYFATDERGGDPNPRGGNFTHAPADWPLPAERRN